MKKVIVFVAMLVVGTTADAQCPNGKCQLMPTTLKANPCTCDSCPKGGCKDCKCPKMTVTKTSSTTTYTVALDEVNAKRVARGLRPFKHDPKLEEAAKKAAEFRARRRIFGHVMSGRGDFQFLPPDAHADSAGCAAYPAHMGWLSCCTYENYTYAGAAYVMGDDGKRYMHLFVRR